MNQNDKKIIINKEKKAVTCIACAINNLLNDANRYNIDPYYFNNEYKGVAYTRYDDEFNESIGVKVASAKAEKNYLNDVLNNSRGGLRAKHSEVIGKIDKLDMLLSTLYKKKINILKALEAEPRKINGIVEPLGMAYVNTEKGVVVQELSIDYIIGRNIINQLYDAVDNLELTCDILNHKVRGKAKVNKKYDEFSIDVGLSISEKKMYLKAIKFIEKRVIELKNETLKEALELTQSIKDVERRKAHIVNNLRKF